MENSELKRKFMDSFEQARRIRSVFPRAEGLTFAEIGVLRQMRACGEDGAKTVTVSDVTACSEISKPALSQIFNSLEAKGILRRSISKTDRRVVELTMTEQGMILLREQHRRLNDFMDRLIEEFGAEKMNTMLDLFGEMTSAAAALKDEFQNETR